MARISDITEELINAAVANDDLTDALYNFQNAIGIDAGDVAGLVFGFGWDDEWPDATPTRRREMMDRYVDRERQYASSDIDLDADGSDERMACTT
jgi:hypothetical protein